MRGATLFSGGGGVEALLKDSIHFAHAVEYDQAIADVYRRNHGDHVQVADVCDVDYSTWGALDYLHASPVCKNASQAKTNGEESETDIRTALAVVRCLEATTPRVFTLENVGGYQRFESYRRICRALDSMGYMWHAEVLNAADYGVPQTRRRLILRAVRDSLLPGLPAPLPWVGWYAAIEDLIPTLPPSKFAPWQLARLPEGLTQSTAVAQGCYGAALSPAPHHEPLFAVTANSNQTNIKTFILDGQTNDSGALLTVRHGQQPMYTLSASMEKRPARAWLLSNNQQEYSDGLRQDDEPSHAITQQSGGRYRAYLVGDQAASHGTGVQIAGEREPAFTLTTRASGGTHPRALLIGSQNSQQEDDGLRWQEEPAMTLSVRQNPRAWLAHGRVVKMTARALARFQSLPDSFWLPEKASLACTVIGNAVPSLLMREIVLPLLGVAQ